MAETPKKSKPGPEPDHLKIEGMDWEDAVKKAMEKKRPKDGWPDASKGQPDDEHKEGQQG